MCTRISRRRFLLGALLLALPGLAWADGKDKHVQPEKKPDLTGVITAVSNETRTITLEIPPLIKGDQATSKEIHFSDKTKIVYFGVDAAGETPTVGYVAQVWLADGSQDMAAGLRMGRKDANSGKGPDFVGRIVAVSQDRKTITLEVDPKEKGEKPTRAEIKLTEKTKLSYFGVDLAGETPSVGYVALVWLVQGSKDNAAGIRLGVKR
jgi:hypothetical protein